MFRIGTPHWLNDEQFRVLLDFFSDYRDMVDEVAFFTSNTHPPLPLDELRRRLERLQVLMMRVREELDVRAGINVLATMGHHEENLDGSLDAPWQRVLDPAGRECRGSYCPNDPLYQDYVRQLYTAVAEAKPDFVWIDDDVRLAGHLPVSMTCFCDYCLARFAKEAEESFTRETLMAALNDAKTDKCFALRRLWLEHNRQMLAELFGIIEQAVHAVVSDLPIGFMTGDRFYEGYAFTRWSQVLAGKKEGEVRWRPGGGFYGDDIPMGLVEKAHDIGRQVAALPRTVEIIQSEIENFPYHRLKKSVSITTLEAAAHMAAGATGIAFNVLSEHAEPLDEYLPFLDTVTSLRPFFATLQKHLGRSPTMGIYPAWNEDLYIANGWSRRDSEETIGMTSEDTTWFGTPNVAASLRRQYVLAEIGLPTCYGRDGACVTTFSGATPLAFSDGELMEIFRGGVFLDVGAWHALDHRGLAHLTGVRPIAAIERDAIEVLTDHHINDSYVGRQRNCRQSFWFEPAYRLEPSTDEVEILAEMVDYIGRGLGPCLSAYENELGGRVVVAGYYPWFLLHNESKATQVKNIFAWLSHDRLPVIVESFAKVAVWARGEPDGEPAIVVLNASFDTIRRLSLKVRCNIDNFEFLSTDSNRTIVCAEQDADLPANYRRVIIESLAPWSIYLLTPVSDS